MEFVFTSEEFKRGSLSGGGKDSNGTPRQKLDENQIIAIGPFPKRHRLVHNGGFPKFEALYCSPNMVGSTEITKFQTS